MDCTGRVITGGHITQSSCRTRQRWRSGVVVGPTDWTGQLELNKQAFVDAWVQRPAFQAAYGGLTNESYVDTLD